MATYIVYMNNFKIGRVYATTEWAAKGLAIYKYGVGCHVEKYNK